MINNFINKNNEIKPDGTTYKESGVDISKEQNSLSKFLLYITNNLENPRNCIGEVLDSIGFFCNVIRISDDLGLAVTCDGVGTKILIAQALHKYDTLGIDCVAMNVNDLICVGAKPISLIDYIALEDPREDLLEQLAIGLVEGCKQSHITIPGGETGQVRDMIRGVRPDYGFDMAAVGLGIVNPKKIITGKDVEPGDIIIALGSSGLHSNGYSLARKVLFKDRRLSSDLYVDSLKKTIGEELLTPTIIYVDVINELLSNENLEIKGLANITGDGLLNLLRIKADVDFVIDNPMAPNEIFNLIQEYGNILNCEMYSTFNMGHGFCLISKLRHYQHIEDVCTKYNIKCKLIGYTSRKKYDEKTIHIPRYNLRGQKRQFSYHSS